LECVKCHQRKLVPSKELHLAVRALKKELGDSFWYGYKAILYLVVEPNVFRRHDKSEVKE